MEPAPSHDPSKPCFAAYQTVYRLSDEFDDDDKPSAHRRPLCGLRIYDVTPQAGDANRVRDLAVRINAATLESRKDGPYCDRLEVIGMPLDSPGLSDLEKARICADYDETERDTRMATGDAAFYLPLRINDDSYRRSLVVIDKLDVTSDWEDCLITKSWSDSFEKAIIARKMGPEKSRFGTFFTVRWQPRPWGWEMLGEPAPPADHVHLLKFPFELLSVELGSDFAQPGIAKFYNHWVMDGLLDQELRRAEEAARQPA